MQRIVDLVKGRDVYVVESHRTVLFTAKYMAERNIGAVAVVRGDDLIGIFSERDLMKRVIAAGRDPQATTVHEVMTTDPMTVSPQSGIAECMRVMRDNSFRHLPICEGRKLKGIVSMRDLLLHDLGEKSNELDSIRAPVPRHRQYTTAYSPGPGRCPGPPGRPSPL